MSDDLPLRDKYRPTELNRVVGQPKAVEYFQKKFEQGRVPHAILLCGPTGVGKTTIGRIVATMLECGAADLTEINAASARGVDDIRNIERMMRMGALQGKCRVWIVDEAHKLTNDAQNAFLKPLEEPPPHVYFILCTTDPGKLIATVRGRCQEVKLEVVDEEGMKRAVMRVAKAEKIPITTEALDRLVGVADGNVRKALVILDALVGIEDGDEQLAAIAAGDFKKAGIEIARALIAGKPWKEVAAIIKAVDFEKEDPEGLRYAILNYGMAVLLNGATNQKAANMVYWFRNNFYDSKKAGLVWAAYEATHATK